MAAILLVNSSVEHQNHFYLLTFSLLLSIIYLLKRKKTGLLNWIRQKLVMKKLLKKRNSISAKSVFGMLATALVVGGLILAITGVGTTAGTVAAILMLSGLGVLIIYLTMESHS